MADINIVILLRDKLATMELIKREYRAAMDDLDYIHGLSFTNTRVSGGTHGDISLKLEKAEERQQGYINTLARLLDQYTGDRERAIELINQLADPTERQVLAARYCDGLSFDDIAESMSYGTDNIYKIHRKALQHLKEL